MARRNPFRTAPPVKPKPFTVLAKPRPIPPGLPSDLTSWYSRHEGIGLTGPEIHDIRIAKHSELRFLEATDLAPPIKGFRGVQIARSRTGLAIVYTLAGALHRFGTIFAIEPAGSFVLDVNHIGWMARLTRDEWIEWGLARERWGTLQKGKSESLKRHFERLNLPQSSVDSGGGGGEVRAT